VGLRPRPRCGSSQRSPRPPSWILGGPISKGEEGKGTGKDRGREGGDKGKRKGRGGTNWRREGRGRDMSPPQLKFLGTPLVTKTLT